MNQARTVVPACVVLAEEVWGSALHVTRSLGRVGVPVFVATAGSGAAVYGRSRYCTAAANFDPSDSVSFCAEVRVWAQGLIQDDQPVVVLPLSDRLVEFLHESRHAFPDQFKLAIPSPEATEALLTKEESLRIAERAGLDVPTWVLVSSSEDLSSLDKLKMPVAVRPTSWSTVGGKYFKIAVCRSREILLEELLGYLNAGAELIVQEYVEASEKDVELAIVWRSEDRSSTAVSTGRKRRQSAAEGGVMIWGETVPLPDVRNGALRFLDTSGFTGLGGIEFIRSEGRRGSSSSTLVWRRSTFLLPDLVLTRYSWRTGTSLSENASAMFQSRSTQRRGWGERGYSGLAAIAPIGGLPFRTGGPSSEHRVRSEPYGRGRIRRLAWSWVVGLRPEPCGRCYAGVPTSGARPFPILLLPAAPKPHGALSEGITRN